MFNQDELQWLSYTSQNDSQISSKLILYDQQLIANEFDIEGPLHW